MAEPRPGPAAAVHLHELIPFNSAAVVHSGGGTPSSLFATTAETTTDGFRMGIACNPNCELSMPKFVAKRLAWMIPSLFAVSVLALALIQLPPRDIVTTYIATLASSNEVIDQNTGAQLGERFGLDQPMLVQSL